MKIEEMKTKAAALCEKLQSAFRGVASIEDVSAYFIGGTIGIICVIVLRRI